MADAEEQQRARERGETIRSELRARLASGPQTAADLLPQLDTAGVSLSEVAFQLDRLAEEGQTAGEQGGPYRLTGEAR